MAGGILLLTHDSSRTGENGADGIRTHDPLVANQVLSQLSYRPLHQY